MTRPPAEQRPDRFANLALASMVCAIVAVPSILVSPVISAALVVVAIVLGAIGFRHRTGKAGVIIGVVVIAAGIVGLLLLAEQDRGSRCEDAATTSDPTDDCR